MKDPIEVFARLVSRYFLAGPAQRPGLAVRAMEAAPHALAAWALNTPPVRGPREIPVVIPRPSLLHRELRMDEEI